MFGARRIKTACAIVSDDISGARKYDVSFRQRVTGWRHGFTAQSFAWYELDKNDPTDYLNDRLYRTRIKGLNEGYDDIFRNKYQFHQTAGDYVEYFPELIGRILGGEVLPEFSNGYTSIHGILADYNSVVLKPLAGSWGLDIHILSSRDGMYILNGGSIPKSEVEDLIEDFEDYIIQEKITQHRFEDEIFPDSLNTVRVTTANAVGQIDPFIAGVGHRFGTKMSAPTDNWHQGGVCAGVNIDTGELDYVVHQRENGGLERLDHHPETKTRVKGESIPHWDEVKDLCLGLSNHYPGASFIGWDIAITDAGPMVIEGNSSPDKDIIQLSTGLFEQDEFKSFVESL